MQRPSACVRVGAGGRASGGVGPGSRSAGQCAGPPGGCRSSPRSAQPHPVCPAQPLPAPPRPHLVERAEGLLAVPGVARHQAQPALPAVVELLLLVDLAGARGGEGGGGGGGGRRAVRVLVQARDTCREAAVQAALAPAGRGTLSARHIAAPPAPPAHPGRALRSRACGKGMPTMITPRALPSAKSSPSDTWRWQGRWVGAGACGGREVGDWTGGWRPLQHQPASRTGLAWAPAPAPAGRTLPRQTAKKMAPLPPATAA